ncbi:TPA: hypothetical protein HA246_05780 [Candidatus Woesearchaeota archaeon]|nr:hypothetical protein [Candidatus Woesearchaeota archaeon]
MGKKIKERKKNRIKLKQEKNSNEEDNAELSRKESNTAPKVVLEKTEANFTYKDYEFEVKRKMFHIVLGFGVVALFYFNIFDASRLLLLILFGLVVCIAAKYYKIPGIQYMLDEFERKENLKHLPGKSVIYFLAGSLLAIVIFPKDIAVASLLILTIGDGISPIIGMSYGRIKHPFSNIKFIEGSIAGAAFSIVGIMLFVYWGYINITFFEAFLASFAAMFFEGIEWQLHRDLQDDNIIIPLVSGEVIYLIRYFL